MTTVMMFLLAVALVVMLVYILESASFFKFWY